MKFKIGDSVKFNTAWFKNIPKTSNLHYKGIYKIIDVLNNQYYIDCYLLDKINSPVNGYWLKCAKKDIHRKDFEKRLGSIIND